jgi:acetyltransferase-like isoleucine patch superfamily enzyme
MEPLLSVCLITYNHVNFIEQAIEGVLMQRVNFPWELIVADDFSTDGTRDILLEYQKKYPNFIKLILQDKNVGPAKNWMDLISEPKTKYIAYFEGDDYWLDPNKLQLQFDFLERNEDFTICCTNAIHINKSSDYIEDITKTLVNPLLPSRIIEKKELASENCILSLTVMYRNIIKDHPKWLLDIPLGDWTMNLLYSDFGKIKYFNDVTAVYRIHEGGIFSLKKERQKLLDYIRSGEIIRKNMPHLSEMILKGQRKRFIQLLYFRQINDPFLIQFDIFNEFKYLLHLNDRLRYRFFVTFWYINNQLKKIKNGIIDYQKNKKKHFPSIKNIHVEKDFIIGNYNNLQIENDVTVEIYSSVIFREYCNIFIAKKAHLIIKKGVFFNNYCSINCLHKIKIGENSIFGEGVKMYDHNHKYTTLPFHVEKGEFTTAPISIGKNCWVGSNVTILKGVTIGDNVIIGANCLIHKSIPSNAIVKHTEKLDIQVIDNY